MENKVSFYDDIAPDEPYVDIEKTKKNQEDTTDGQQPIVPVVNVPQQAGLEGVGSGYNPAPLLLPNNEVLPARGDGAAQGKMKLLEQHYPVGKAAPPAEAIVPQEKVAQIARETVALAVELLQMILFLKMCGLVVR